MPRPNHPARRVLGRRQEEAASLHPEMQIPPGEAEDVTFLDELEQSGLPQDDSSVLPVVSNERVEAFIELFEGPQKQWMERALRRSGRYSQRMKQILREEGLPEDLVYLALIESGFNPYAYSRAKAMGIWQFIPGTGRRYGLVINWWIDERRDLEKSARAAAHYLKNLYGLFDDWYLAAAAYNAGEGKMQRAIRKYDSTCFWDLSQYRYLQRETKNYVPKFLAALTIAKDPGRYGFADVEYDAPLLYETVTVPDATDLAVIAKGCGKSLSLLNKLNPQLLRGCTPPDYPDYEVKIPLGTKESFLAYYSQLDPAETPDLSPAPDSQERNLVPHRPAVRHLRELHRGDEPVEEPALDTGRQEPDHPPPGQLRGDRTDVADPEARHAAGPLRPGVSEGRSRGGTRGFPLADQSPIWGQRLLPQKVEPEKQFFPHSPGPEDRRLAERPYTAEPAQGGQGPTCRGTGRRDLVHRQARGQPLGNRPGIRCNRCPTFSLEPDRYPPAHTSRTPIADLHEDPPQRGRAHLAPGISSGLAIPGLPWSLSFRDSGAETWITARLSR